jgi:hypothetical protein
VAFQEHTSEAGKGLTVYERALAKAPGKDALCETTILKESNSKSVSVGDRQRAMATGIDSTSSLLFLLVLAPFSTTDQRLPTIWTQVRIVIKEEKGNIEERVNIEGKVKTKEK